VAEDVEIFVAEAVFTAGSLEPTGPVVVKLLIERKVLREYHKEHVWLFDKDGQIVEHQSYQMEIFNLFWIWPIKYRVGYYAHGKVTHYQDSIMDVLQALGENASRVQYAVSYHEWTRGVIVYKAVRDLDLVSYKTRFLERQVTEQEAEFKAYQEQFRKEVVD
jgi:hypothetical protein